MSDYDDLTIHDVMSAAELAEDERDAELRLDAADEERALREDAEEAARAAESGDPEDCGGEFIDGIWYGCGDCEPCLGASEDPLDVEDEFDGAWA